LPSTKAPDVAGWVAHGEREVEKRIVEGGGVKRSDLRKDRQAQVKPKKKGGELHGWGKGRREELRDERERHPVNGPIRKGKTFNGGGPHPPAMTVIPSDGCQ